MQSGLIRYFAGYYCITIAGFNGHTLKPVAPTVTQNAFDFYFIPGFIIPRGFCHY
jgi:hypothetical protein